MSTDGLAPSEYDKAADFYLKWLDRKVPDRDRRIPQSVEVMLGMLGDIRGSRVCDLGCGEGFLSRILARRGPWSRVSTSHGICCAMRGSIPMAAASPGSWTMRSR